MRIQKKYFKQVLENIARFERPSQYVNTKGTYEIHFLSNEYKNIVWPVSIKTTFYKYSKAAFLKLFAQIFDSASKNSSSRHYGEMLILVS